MSNISLNDIGNEKFWYVLRVTYQRELIAKSEFDKLGIKNFVPTHEITTTNRNGKRITKQVAIIHNYLFVYSSKEKIDEIKSVIPWLRYVMQPTGDNNKKIMTVPDRQMDFFMAVAGNSEEDVAYICPDEVSLSKGDYVRITGGPFEGVEGIYMRINNKRQRSVVIKIEGITAVATATIPRILVEKITN